MKLFFILWMFLITVFSVLPDSNSGVLQLTSYKLTNSGFFIHLISFFIAALLCFKAFKHGSLNLVFTSGVLLFLYSILLAAYLVFLFWGRFDTIVFYNMSIPISPLVLLAVFIIWFVGIYNAVNLLDGLDGLAGGFMFILLAGLAVSGTGEFFQLNGIFTLVLLSFLTFNQRPSNIDDKTIFKNIVNVLTNDISDKFPLIWPVHPRTKKQLINLNLWDELKKIKI